MVAARFECCAERFCVPAGVQPSKAAETSLCRYEQYTLLSADCVRRQESPSFATLRPDLFHIFLDPLGPSLIYCIHRCFAVAATYRNVSESPSQRWPQLFSSDCYLRYHSYAILAVSVTTSDPIPALCPELSSSKPAAGFST